MELTFEAIRRASIKHIEAANDPKERANRVARTRKILDYIHHRRLRQTLRKNGGFWGRRFDK